MRSISRPVPGLRALARAYGIETSYSDVEGKRQAASPEALLQVLRSLGAPLASFADVPAALRQRRLETASRFAEPVVVAWGGRSPVIELSLYSPGKAKSLRLHLDLESGEARDWTVALDDLPVVETKAVESVTYERRRLVLPEGLPDGYHRLRIECGREVADCLVIAAPRQAYVGGISRDWGVFLPLYSLRTARSAGLGDLTDLRALAAWTGERGGSVVATLPILASFLDEPCDYSPYTPVSRLFWNELYIDTEDLPGSHDAAVLEERGALAATELVDYRRQFLHNRALIEHAAAEWPQAGTKAYLASRPEALDYARFRAAGERERAVWRRWPARQQGGDLRPGDYDDTALAYHLVAQQLAERQLAECAEALRSRGQRLYLDYPVGVHPDGYDVWRHPSLFALDVSTGAPPDTFFTKGQDWSFHPFLPEALRRDGYAHLIATWRHHLRYADILRIDHVMGLHRLFWIGHGFEAKDGVYVRYPAEEMYAILCLESQRHQATIVGEDLGTVPPVTRRAMARHRIGGSYVVEMEARPDPERSLPPAPPLAVATIGTHDMPTFAGYLHGFDIADRVELGHLALDRAPRETETRAAQAAALSAFVTGKKRPKDAEVVAGATRWVAASPARLQLINIEDLWLETAPQNVPGTASERPNWRRRARYRLEEWPDLPGLEPALRTVDRLRKGPRMDKTHDMPGLRPIAGGSATPVLYHGSRLTDDDIYLFNEGSHFRLYDKLGAHPGVVDGIEGCHFAVWAPDAERVSVVGDFNGWDRDAHPLWPRQSSGIWEGFIAGVGKGAVYKYFVASRFRGYKVEKADPYAFMAEVPPKTASVVWGLDYDWGDYDWMASRGARNALDAPISVYEVHLGSWMRVPEDGGRALSYRELAPKLAEYVRKLGFTHVEFLPVMEHPFGGSWGYQVSGYFAPTSRFGTPQDFMYLVDYLHQHDIGVILDWVPSHFPNDEHALGYFDGSYLYEHADVRQRIHPDWDSLIFNYGRAEVRSFLTSSALFWLDHYHADGLRVDAVASMLYLDYSRKAGEWVPNRYGGRENLEAIDFIRRLNEAVYGTFPDVQTVAEESTAWPAVSRPAYAGGLGFGMKWDMGWMHDTLKYMELDPVHRRYHHNELTFRMVYAFTENFCLPLSHDEVVHGKGSLLRKMPGDDWQKFANLRLLYAYMYAQPGKKLLFMGAEFGQWDEWSHEASLQWHLLAWAPHEGVQRLVGDLNRVYREQPALHRLDFDGGGYSWLEANDADNSTLAFIRHSGAPEDDIVVVCNFTPVPRQNYRAGVPAAGRWQEVLNTDSVYYDGSGQGNLGSIEAVPVPYQGRPYSINLTLPPLAAVYFKRAP